MSEHAFFAKRLQFFTGKGGVGKSSIVAGLAYLAASRGKRVLVVEVDTESAMKRIFDVPFVGFIPMEALDNLWIVNINPDEALLEYIEEHVRLEMLARRISQNGILQYFFKAAPAVNEMVEINKVYNLFNEKDPLTNQPRFDLILVDLPATGHAISFLSLPTNMVELLGIGPLRKMVDKYQKLFDDPQSTGLSLVTLPEEMPVTETIELYQHIKNRLSIPLDRIFVNATPDVVFDRDEAAMLKHLEESSVAASRLNGVLSVGRQALSRQTLASGLIARLKQEISLPLITLPRILVGRFDRQAVAELAHAFPEAETEASS
jgi:anion-transporting  ArsA/GET3 family ATPase